MSSSRVPVVVITDDDQGDCRLMEKACSRVSATLQTRFVHSACELLAYLDEQERHSNAVEDLLPAIIMLDLNMPGMNGRAALQAIKSNPKLRRIPVVILTTSRDDLDIDKCYDLGANSFVTKPDAFQDLVHTMDRVTNYWLNVVQLPRRGSETCAPA